MDEDDFWDFDPSDEPIGTGKLLIVVDMQNDFIGGALGTKEAQKILPDVVEKIKTFEGPVLFTQDTHEKNYLETQEGKKLPVEHCIRETEGWKLHPEIAALVGDEENIIKKPTFGSAEMAAMLGMMSEKFEIESITLIGLCTDICVISNAMTLKAFLPEVPIIVDSKCCAGVTPESHENALRAMRACQIEIV
ncbi:MAG: cysteine hydrolase [Hespellia sp.]|nr:cysteine hydrolase [Hespellia sp.]